MARQAAAPEAPKNGAVSAATAPAQGEKGLRRPDEITLKVPNPLLVHQDAPRAPAIPPRLEQRPPITAKLKNASLAWEEFNAMPVTPPPVPLGQAAPVADNPVSEGHPQKRRAVMLGLGALAVTGVIAGVFALRGNSAPQASRLPERHPNEPVVAAPEKPLPEKPVNDLPKTPAAVVEAPSVPSTPAKRQVKVSVEPAEATLVLDGTVAGSNAIAMELAQDHASHLVLATAPGYLPFKKSFTLDADVNLRINLKKAAVAVRGGHPKARLPDPAAKPPEVEARAKPMAEVRAKPTTEPTEDFGMDLTRPAAKRQVMKMDEKDPYAP